MKLTHYPGYSFPLGATWDGNGVNFALYSENATAIELCLFSGDDGTTETVCIGVKERINRIWHCHVPGLGYGQKAGLLHY